METSTGELIRQTLSRYIGPGTRILAFESTPIQSGMSGAEITRYELVVQTAADKGPHTVRLITKMASLRERRTLAWLNAQEQPIVPYSHTLDLISDAPALVCLQDVGDTCRPTSLEPITPEQLRREAKGLASIHARNFGLEHSLSWLPRLDSAYIEDYVLERCWRPHWQAALARQGLAQVLRPFISRVEARADSLVADCCRLLFAEPDCFTLIHTDINPSNVLVQDGMPFYIDWQTPHYGPFYLDLPHHFCTLQQAQYYRDALAAARGRNIPASHFAQCYSVAASVIGFRYIWWTLEEWQGSSSDEDTAWVLHYLNLIDNAPL